MNMASPDTLTRVMKELRLAKDTNPEVLYTYMTWQNAKQHYQRRLYRSMENWRFYLALDPELGLGQWPQKVVARMLSQGRQLLTYNFAKTVVDTIAGGIMQVPFMPEFYPVNEEITSLTEVIKKAMFSDKDLMDWNTAYKDLVDAGLVFEGVLKGVISTEFHKLGNIGYEMTLPGSVIPDPMWKTSRSKDCRECFHEQWFQPDVMMEMWGDAVPQLERDIEAIKRTGPQYGAYTGVTPFSTDDDTWGTAQRVVSHYRMINRKYKQAYIITETGEKLAIPKEAKDAVDVIQWLNGTLGEGGWEPDRIYEDDEEEKVCIVRRICPSISWTTIIEEKPTEWQTGRLPFFWWSASRANGEPHSIIDSIKDVQMNINYHESLITHKLQVEGGGGAQFIDRDQFETSEEADRYTENRNDPSENFFVRPGAFSNGAGAVPATPILKSNMPQEAYEHLNHIINTILPHVSKVNSAQRGAADTAHTSGYLFKMEKMQSDQQLFTIHFGLKEFWNEVYDSYLMQAASTYSNEAIPRKFTLNKGKESVILNEPVTLPDGSKGIKNDVSKLKEIRHKIIVSEVQDSPTKKLENLQVYGELMGRIPPSMPATLVALASKSMKCIDQFDEEDREILDQINDKELELALLNIDGQIANAQLNLKNIQNQLNPPPAPAPGTAAPGVQGAPQQTTPGAAPSTMQPQSPRASFSHNDTSSAPTQTTIQPRPIGPQTQPVIPAGPIKQPGPQAQIPGRMSP